MTMINVDKMTPKERMLARFAGEPVDRFPVSVPNWLEGLEVIPPRTDRKCQVPALAPDLEPLPGLLIYP